MERDSALSHPIPFIIVPRPPDIFSNQLNDLQRSSFISEFSKFLNVCLNASILSLAVTSAPSNHDALTSFLPSFPPSFLINLCHPCALPTLRGATAMDGELQVTTDGRDATVVYSSGSSPLFFRDALAPSAPLARLVSPRRRRRLCTQVSWNG